MKVEDAYCFDCKHLSQASGKWSRGTHYHCAKYKDWWLIYDKSCDESLKCYDCLVSDLGKLRKIINAQHKTIMKLELMRDKKENKKGEC
jgi:hypothetical protein